MTENDLAERVRQYGSFLDGCVRKAEDLIKQEREQLRPTIGWEEEASKLTSDREDGTSKLSEAYGQETAYRNSLREFQERFPEYKPETGSSITSEWLAKVAKEAAESGTEEPSPLVAGRPTGKPKR